jgi:hypothetical protein
MNEQQPQPQPQDERRGTTTDEDVPTAVETGRSPRPSQAEGDRETVEEDLEEQR